MYYYIHTFDITDYAAFRLRSAYGLASSWRSWLALGPAVGSCVPCLRQHLGAIKSISMPRLIPSPLPFMEPFGPLNPGLRGCVNAPFPRAFTAHNLVYPLNDLVSRIAIMRIWRLSQAAVPWFIGSPPFLRCTSSPAHNAHVPRTGYPH